MRNIQRRDIEAPAAAVGALLDRLASDADPLWPAPAWPPIRFDRGLAVGSVGGHGPIRYSVAEYVPGRRVRFVFDPSIGLDGYHELIIEPLDERRTRLTHDLVGRPRGTMRLVWPLAVRWMHEALLQDLLDNAELIATGRLREKALWSRWVRFMRARMSPKPQGVPLPETAVLAATELSMVDFLDAWRLPVPPGVRHSPQAWHEAMFRNPPGWVTSLMRLRNRLAPAMGVRRIRPGNTFRILASNDTELLAGGDNADFTLRISMLVEPGAVTCSTLTRARRGRGRAYLALIRPFHARVVRAMLRRAARTLTARTPEAVAQHLSTPA